MWHYDAPLRDMRFVIEHVLDAPSSWARCPALADCDVDTVRQVLDEAARFSSEVLAPTNGPGDLEGCTLGSDGSVTTPSGYRAAYRAFVEGGWPALGADPRWDGQGLPLLLEAALTEMLNACNQAWTMYPGLLHGAYESIKAHGTDELKQRYLPRLVSGEWLAAMALTEPQAGTDLGLVRTRAQTRPDGTLRVTGNKIFISGGEHDLTDNIVHLVLCRLADAPPGTKGLSLALVPKWLPDGTRNAMHCDGIEKKMGIKGSATCAMRYEEATGWLIGEPNRGLAAMFIMMNSARLHVGLQGLGQIEMASQNALRYARERVQMKRAVRAGAASPAAAADPIVVHPAVRRILLRLQAVTEGCRVLAYRAAQLIDESHAAEDASQRRRADALAALLTPIVKAFITHQGFHGAVAAQQVYGGHGYVHEYGIEQAVRDARIAMIYEGTNEIQAIDLLVRKVLGSGASAFEDLLADLSAEADRCQDHPALTAFASALKREVAAARGATQALQTARGADPERPYRVADDYLSGMGLLLLGWAWAASARAAIASAGGDEEWTQRKLAICRHGIDWVLPEAALHWQRVMEPVLALAEIPLS